MVDGRLRSSLSTEIVFTRDAVRQVLDHVFDSIKGETFVLDGMGIEVRELITSKLSLSSIGIYQSVELYIVVEKPGWIKSHGEVPLQLDCSYQLETKNHFPSIQVDQLNVTVRDQIALNIGKIKLKNRRFDRYVVRQVEKRQLFIQKQINLQLADRCKKYTGELIYLPNPKFSKIQPRSLSFEQVQWATSHAGQCLQARINALYRIAVEENKSTNCNWRGNSGLEIQEANFFRIRFYREEIEGLLVQTPLPKGHFKNSKIESAELSELDPLQCKIELNISGDLEAKVLLGVRIVPEDITRLTIDQFQIDVANKLLDFGLQLFETKIAHALQDKLNQYIHEVYQGLLNKLNVLSEQYSAHFKLDNRKPFELNEVTCSLEFDEETLMLTIRSSRPKHIEVHSIPSELLETKKT